MYSAGFTIDRAFSLKEKKNLPFDTPSKTRDDIEWENALQNKSPNTPFTHF